MLLVVVVVVVVVVAVVVVVIAFVEVGVEVEQQNTVLFRLLAVAVVYKRKNEGSMSDFFVFQILFLFVWFSVCFIFVMRINET
jgi:hypothetical protein